MKRWTIWACAVEPVYASDGGLLDYAETDVEKTIAAETAADAVDSFHDWLAESGIETAGELFIESVQQG